MKKIIILFTLGILLILICKMMFNQNNTLQSGKNNGDIYKDNTIEYESIQEKDISQWALSNLGENFYSSEFSNDWEEDRRVSQKGIDINYK